MSLILDEHRLLLDDPPRLRAFSRAIERVVRRGDVVVDLGAGTGILGLMACRAGAARVYSIEEDSTIGLTREIAAANGFADRVVAVKGRSTHVSLPERADLVMADQIGRFGFEAGIFEYFSDARERFLKPAARALPSRIDLEVAPVERADQRELVQFWQQPVAGFDLGAAAAVARNTGYPARLEPADLLAKPATIASLDTTSTVSTVEAACSFEIERPGTLDGLGGWFSSELVPGVVLTNSPLSAERIQRRNVFLPIDPPVDVEDGEIVRVQLHMLPAETMLSWVVEVAVDSAAPARARASHSTLRGMLLCREDLARGQPSFVPSLSPRGHARRTVLELCNGLRPLAEVESEVQRRHADLFGSPGAAQGFVAEVVSVYAEPP